MAVFIPLVATLLVGRRRAGAASARWRSPWPPPPPRWSARSASASRWRGSSRITSEEVVLLSALGLVLIVAGIAEQLQVSAAVGAFLVGIALSGRDRAPHADAALPDPRLQRRAVLPLLRPADRRPAAGRVIVPARGWPSCPRHEGDRRVARRRAGRRRAATAGRGPRSRSSPAARCPSCSRAWAPAPRPSSSRSPPATCSCWRSPVPLLMRYRPNQRTSPHGHARPCARACREHRPA